MRTGGWLLAAALLAMGCKGDERRDDDGDGVSEADGDCDDTRADVSPNAEEVCDGVDNDCNGEVDDSAADAELRWTDADGDGLGTGEPYLTCSGGALEGGDCDDDDASVGLGDTFYSDVDRDGYGTGDGTVACNKPPDTSDVGGDCDDADPDTHPGAATDVPYDGVDTDCDCTNDFDADGDGYMGDQATYETAFEAFKAQYQCSFAVEQWGDCDDADADLNPEAVWYEDTDGDGFGDDSTATAQCAPPATGTWVRDGGDCGPTDPTRYPGAPELCIDASAVTLEGIDNDCDGQTDEDCPELVCGDVTADATWADNGVGYYLTCNVVVGSTDSADPAVLTVAPGVSIYTRPGFGLQVGTGGTHGTLAMVGTTTDPILYDSYGRDDAGSNVGLAFGAGSVGSEVAHTEIRDGGTAVTVDQGELDLHDCEVRNSRVAAVQVTQASPRIVDNLVDGCEGDGFVFLDGATPTDPTRLDGNTLRNGARRPIRMRETWGFGNLGTANRFESWGTPYVTAELATPAAGLIAESQVWANLGAGYRPGGTVLVEGAPTPVLTIEDGIQVEFRTGDYGLDVGLTQPGDLVLEHSADGVALHAGGLEPSAGDYLGVHIGRFATAATRLDGLTLEHAGRSGSALWVESAVDRTLADLTITDGYFGALFVEGGGLVTLTDSHLGGRVSFGDGVTAAVGTHVVRDSTIDSLGEGLQLRAGESVDVRRVDIARASDVGIRVGTDASLSLVDSQIRNVSGNPGNALHMDGGEIRAYSGNLVDSPSGYAVHVSDASWMQVNDGTNQYTNLATDAGSWGPPVGVSTRYRWHGGFTLPDDFASWDTTGLVELACLDSTDATYTIDGIDIYGDRGMEINPDGDCVATLSIANATLGVFDGGTALHGEQNDAFACGVNGTWNCTENGPHETRIYLDQVHITGSVANESVLGGSAMSLGNTPDDYSFTNVTLDTFSVWCATAAGFDIQAVLTNTSLGNSATNCTWR